MSSLISIGVSEIGIDDRVRVPAVFTKNRDRLLTTEMSRKVMAAILVHREVAPLLSDGHFSVDGTLTRAWASMKSFQPKPGIFLPDDEGTGRSAFTSHARSDDGGQQPGTAAPIADLMKSKAVPAAHTIRPDRPEAQCSRARPSSATSSAAC